MEYVITIKGEGKRQFLKSSQYLGHSRRGFDLTTNQDDAEVWADKKAAEAWCEKMWEGDGEASVVPANVPVVDEAKAADTGEDKPAGKGAKGKAKAADTGEDKPAG